jgi:hypothetical protein
MRPSQYGAIWSESLERIIVVRGFRAVQRYPRNEKTDSHINESIRFRFLGISE